MAYAADVSGQLNIKDEATNNVAVNFDLSKVFTKIASVKEFKFVERELIDTDGVVSIPTDGVASLKGFILRVSGTGSVTLKHDSNTNGITINEGILLFGSIASITIETAATQALAIQYAFFE